jgi:trans-aconitate methyltransferase
MVSDQRWDPDAYARNARFVSDLGAGVVELLAATAGERILDLGCGDGALTRMLAEAGCRVVGVDGSPEQVVGARALGIDARVGSGETLDFDAEFDAVFSNAALHWMRRADLVIAGVWRALVPGGRFVGEMGGHGCVEHIRRALIAALDRRGLDGTAADPWYFPTAEGYRALLEAQGFRVDMMKLFARPTPLPGDIVGWLETFAQSFTAVLPGVERPAFLAEVRDALRPALCDADGQWTADYVRLRFAALKPR